MLTRDVAYIYGLANGTRGTFVGIAYGPGGIGTSPEALIIDVPDYCGPCFFEGEPTWVPILPVTAFKDGTRTTQTQPQVVAGFGLTVNKAQGLTIKEGIVIHLVGSKRFRPASKHGLPFVAFTRSENFAMTAFKNLPAWEDFEKGRESDMLRMRKSYMKRLDEMHERTMAAHSHMRTSFQEEMAQDVWQRAQRKKNRKVQEPRLPCPACASCVS